MNHQSINAQVAFAPFRVDSSRQLRLRIPDNATSGRIIITTPFGSGQSATNFIVIPGPKPLISSFTPEGGASGTIATITGTGLARASSVKIGDIAAPFRVDSTTQVRTKIPANASSGCISITTPFGTAQSATNFEIASQPRALSTIVPLSKVRFSVAKIENAGQLLRLIFTGALDANTARDVERYRAEVGGVTLEIESVQSKGDSVILNLASALKSGDEVSLQWHDLRDAGGKTLSGSTISRAE